MMNLKAMPADAIVFASKPSHRSSRRAAHERDGHDDQWAAMARRLEDAGARFNAHMARDTAKPKWTAATGFWQARSCRPWTNPRAAVVTRPIQGERDTASVPEGCCLLETEPDHTVLSWRRGIDVVQVRLTSAEFDAYCADGTIVE
ncbi:hypothetical protein [Pigmentiphaga litoralis]|uniref:Uncharacterized protein n=1 Tax=Pigmentiphaga litoralis TaxID=516702 RepID=A0A7Y9IUX6_9BURK|nr:hypothetical protein [Pigmentiphaga litoralis]NYE23702.1 hypothetical protein [Pigmentiphaga litoralis]NYE82684.1 hypothetical protein [Pigmentiphaga litoralis]